ncbi:Methyltransferase domain-containing protein [Evansella caseinilytica]|uniref:Methyltransferase domain-containing protein n=1 Tax=Evansella caseinilytica TaxID=1503961 RepID=A0A1H3UAX6_9BACI|nr:methyltransferase domain-containing protein [Evansella caseinilytica]SDZ58965.1 Methyltransferase domain-containing protein [Evansella caseinilytica]
MFNDNQFISLIRGTGQQFSGWDFSFITGTGRVQSGLLPWSYGSMILPFVQNAGTVLDMGTGGGEFLANVRPLPDTVYATEGYKPNIPIASKRLTPLGVKVVPLEEDDALPFNDAYFDLIINRHESYSLREVRRIISDEGMFITQQVGGTDCSEINERLGVSVDEEYADWHLNTASKEIANHHFEIIDCQEAFPLQRFYDIGALVYYLKAIPWQVADFDTEKYMKRLYQIHQIIQTKGYFEVKQHRFIILAKAI